MLAFCTSGRPANNTVYQRATTVRTFFRWCEREGLMAANPAAYLSGRESPLRSYKRTYGKVQALNPGRWLTHQEAFGTLVAICQDGTSVGLRDEVVLRLGLLGMRAAEMRSLNLSHVDHLPALRWTGKGHKPRSATAGAALVAAVQRYLELYQYPAQTPR